MKLIDEWKEAWRYLSVQLSSAFAVASLTWLALPDEQRSAILSALGINPGWVVAVSFLVVVVARIKAQTGLDGKP